MESRNTISTELAALSEVVAGIPPHTPYEVPAGYFNELPALLLNRVKAADAESAMEEIATLSPLLSGLNKQTPFSIPAGYFEELAGNAMAGAKAIEFVQEELENLPPVLSQLKHKAAYEVPAGYFETLPSLLLQKVQAQPSTAAPVISMRPRRKVWGYAVAAVIAGVLAVTAWWMIRPGTDQGNGAVLLANMEKVSDNELQVYVENQVPLLDEAVASVGNPEEMDANALDEMLADVSDEELQQYLDQYSNIKKTLTN